jgi:hypothetical protein
MIAPQVALLLRYYSNLCRDDLVLPMLKAMLRLLLMNDDTLEFLVLLSERNKLM